MLRNQAVLRIYPRARRQRLIRQWAILREAREKNGTDYFTDKRRLAALTLMADYWKLEAKKTYPVVENGQCVLTPIYDMVNTEVHGFRDILALPMNENSSPNPSMRIEREGKQMTEGSAYKLTKKAHERVFRGLLLEMLENSGEPKEQPRIVILGGQPGSGKSKLTAKLSAYRGVERY